MRNCFFLFCLLVSLNTAAQEINQEARKLTDVLIEKFMSQSETPPGISIAIKKENAMEHAQGYGYADVSQQIPVNPHTAFRIASVSKLITATALAHLIQEGKIDVDAPILNHYVDVPEEYAQITARQLAGHIGGVPHYSAQDKREDRFYSSIDDALSVFMHVSPISEPGSAYQYSTYSYVLLSKVIEEVSGQPFLEYVEGAVFQSSAMTHSGPELTSSSAENPIYYYDFISDETQQRIPSAIKKVEDLSYKWAGGGMISSAADLVNMGSSYYNGVLNKDVLDQMYESQKLNSGVSTGVGIGWRTSYDMHGRKVYEHAGYMTGTRSVLSLFPDDKLAISILANSHKPYRIEETAHMVALPYLTKPAPLPQPRGTSDVSMELTDYDGSTSQAMATIVLNGKTDRMEIKYSDGTLISYTLTYMQRDNIYALIHPDGILYTEIEMINNELQGKVYRYRSPLFEPPSTQKPYMKFSGKFIPE